MKKAILISCFGWYKDRLEYVEKYIGDRGYEVQVLTSDFLHFEKKRAVLSEGCNYIHVPAYKKNLSFDRMYSHYIFARQIYNILQLEKPDIVYANIPPNFVAYFCGKYKRMHPETKLIYDIIDMWPESYTAKKILDTPFRLWAWLRDNNLKYADYIFTECKLYQMYLPCICKEKMSVLHLVRETVSFSSIPEWNGKEIDIGYLGSINNIIDINLIVQLMDAISKTMKVSFHVVGGGEKMIDFVKSLSTTGVKVVNHGVIFEKKAIRSIIGKCHFAINIMKPSVCVGLTIKSMDYFQIGIPFFNTIKGDSTEIVYQYGCGYNVDDVHKCAEKVEKLNNIKYRKMRLNTQKAFVDLFTMNAFYHDLDYGLNKFFHV